MFRRATLVGVTLALSLSLAPAGAQEDRLEQIAEFAAVGASRFALHLLDRYQPVVETSPDLWIHWERERTLIYIDTNEWRALLGRVSQRPQGLPSDFLRWQDTRVARAWLELGEIDKARNLLLALIWNTPPSERSDHFAPWRELIIRTYLAEGRYGDAHVAWLRHHLDYAQSAPASHALSAEVLLRVGQIAAAADYLESPQTGRERLLAAIIESELGRLSATQMWQRVETILALGRFDPTLALEAWIALKSVAVRDKQLTLGCRVLERALTLFHQRPLTAEDAGITGDALWECYEMVAHQTANANQLLVGRFEDWLGLIDSGSITALEKRALLAFLVLNDTGEIREAAESRLIEAVQLEPQGERILASLYLSSSRAHRGGELADIARYPLVELALRDADLGLAERLSAGLGRSSLAGQLIEARIQLRQHRDAGIAAIRSLLGGAENLSGETAGRFRSTISELAGILPDDEVLQLLEQLRDKTAELSDRAETQLSIGAIEMRLLKFQQAALSFLRASRSTTDAAIERDALLYAARALSLGRMNDQARELYLQMLTKPLAHDERGQVMRELERLGMPP